MLLASGAAPVSGGPALPPTPLALPAPSPQSPIAAENRRPGTTSWQSPALARAAANRGPALRNETRRTGWPGSAFDKPPLAVADWTDTCLRGYADRASINKGESVRFMVSTAQPTVTINVYRVGWYGGAGMSLKFTVNVPGQNQPVPTPQAGTGLIEANWAPSYTLQTDAGWVSGVYLVKLTTPNCDDGYLEFVLRDDTQQADVLYQVATNTYQAYNNWGGKSLYDYQSTGGVPAVKVSYDRPYADWAGAGMFFDGDFNMIRFLESQGYNITYATSVDTQANPSILNGRKVFLSDWHDEYWSRTMRDNITNARNAGKHLAWFDSNNVYWQVRFENSTSGVPNRVIVCYKDDPDNGPPQDPIAATNPSLDTTQWRLAPVNQPENALLGIMFESLFDYSSAFPWVVTNASHWIYAGTGLQNGQSIPDLVGYEYDKVWNNGQTPPNVQVLATSPVVDVDGVHSAANATIYQAASGAYVFSAGTNKFAWKVDDNPPYQAHGVDTRAQQIVRNVLNGLIGAAPIPTATPVSATPTRTPSPGPTNTPAPTATPTPAPSCAPRPQVTVRTTAGSPGRLTVSVVTSTTAHDFLEGIQFGAATNALIDAGPLVGSTGNAAITTPPGAFQYTFTVRRATAGQAATVPMTVVTACGSWPTFVGGGAAAFQTPS